MVYGAWRLCLELGASVYRYVQMWEGRVTVYVGRGTCRKGRGKCMELGGGVWRSGDECGAWSWCMEIG